MYGTSWPNFKIVVSWGVGRPRRWGNSQLMEPEHTHLSIKVTNLCGHFSCYFNGVSKPDIYIYHQRSVTIDHHNKYNKSEKVWNIVRITKLWHRDTNWANSVGKNGANRLAQYRVATPLQLVKNTVSMKCNRGNNDNLFYCKPASDPLIPGVLGADSEKAPHSSKTQAIHHSGEGDHIRILQD